LWRRSSAVVTGGPVVRRQAQHRLEQGFRIVEHVLLEPDPRQQPHGLDVVAVLEKVRPDDSFGRYEFAVGKHGGGSDDVGRQPCKSGHVRGCHLGVLGLSGHPIERL
jgi:hypothetical protein